MKLYSHRDLQRALANIDMAQLSLWTGIEREMLHAMARGLIPLTTDVHEFLQRVFVDVPRLRALLKRHNWSQRKAARLAGVNPRTMRRYCSGELYIPPNVWIELERAAQATHHN